MTGTMGCEISKFDKKICKNAETPKVHVDYIRKHGFGKYDKLMGIQTVTSEDSEDRSIDDHSSSMNFGLVNLETKSESETSYDNFYEGIGWKELVELAIGAMIVI